MDKTIASTAIATVLLGTFAAAAFVYSGAFNVAATDPNSPPVTWPFETARVRSIKAHAAGIEVPASFEAQNNVQDAAGHFVAHCATCHGAPGVDRNDFADRMYPRPPDLTDVGKPYSPAELFWILKNGIKMTGMPSMADDGDDLLWATVGLLEKLPGMTPDTFKTLVVAAQASGGAHHHDHAHGHTVEMHMDNGGARQADGLAGQTAMPAPEPHGTQNQ